MVKLQEYNRLRNLLKEAVYSLQHIENKFSVSEDKASTNPNIDRRQVSSNEWLKSDRQYEDESNCSSTDENSECSTLMSDTECEYDLWWLIANFFATDVKSKYPTYEFEWIRFYLVSRHIWNNSTRRLYWYEQMF